MRKIIAVVVVMLIAGAVWWYASPIWTLHQMQAASKAHDAAKLSAYVDYPALRADLKGDIRGYVLAEAGQEGHGGGSLGAAVALALLGPIVDAAVTPEGVQAMFAAQDRKAPGSAGKAAPVSAGNDPVIERDGLSSFRVHDKDARKGALVFHRAGLGWKLAGVDLPER